MWSPDYERQLVRRWQAGDREAGDEIVAANFDLVRRFFATRVAVPDRLDLIQDTFMRLSLSIGNFRAVCRLRTYLLGIARNVLFEHRRGTKCHVALDSSPGDETNLRQSSYVRRREQYARLLWALAELPERSRNVLEYYYWSGMASREIAEMLGQPPSSIRRQLYHGRERLRELVALSENVSLSVEQLDDALIELGNALAGEPDPAQKYRLNDD